jgi:hypothetical protein
MVQERAPGGGIRRGWLLATLIALVVVVGVIVALSIAPRSADSSPPSHTSTASPTSTPGSASASADPTPTSASEPTPSSTGEPVPAPAPSPTELTVFPQLDPVPPDTAVKIDDLAVQITRVEHVTGESIGAGEVSDDALRLTIAITNPATEDMNLDLVVVNAYYGADLKPSDTYEQPGGKPFGGSLTPGKTATGVLLFRVPKAQQNDVTVTVDYIPGKPAVVFKGDFS